MLDQRTVEAVREAVLSAPADAPLCLDGSAVERVGTVGVQFLLSTARTAEEAERPFQIVSPSAALRDTIAALGLERRFTSWIRA